MKENQEVENKCKHQQNLYEKLGVSDRAAGVAEAMRR